MPSISPPATAFGSPASGELKTCPPRVTQRWDVASATPLKAEPGEARLEMTTDLAAEIILIDVPLEFEPVGVWAGEW